MAVRVRSLSIAVHRAAARESLSRDPQKTLDNFDFNFNKKMNRSLVFDLATANLIAKHEDALFLGPPGTGKSHLAQAIGQAAIQQGYRVLYREAHKHIEDLADAALDHNRKEQMELFSTVPLLIIDDLGMRKLPATDTVTAMLDRLLHHGHVLKCEPRSWRTKTQIPNDDKNENSRRIPGTDTELFRV
jgi:DNA replication protein DnaC